jgi:hypothetical protein
MVEEAGSEKKKKKPFFCLRDWGGGRGKGLQSLSSLHSTAVNKINYYGGVEGGGGLQSHPMSTTSRRTSTGFLAGTKLFSRQDRFLQVLRRNQYERYDLIMHFLATTCRAFANQILPHHLHDGTRLP